MDNIKEFLRPAEGRKCLFGRSNAQEIDSFLDGQLRSIGERQKEQWNFDFEKEEPFPGNWEWTKVEPERIRQEQTAERPQLVESMGTASQSRVGANPRPPTEEQPDVVVTAASVDSKVAETERDDSGIAHFSSGKELRADEFVSVSPSKSQPTGADSPELRRSPRKKTPTTIPEYYPTRKRSSGCTDGSQPGSSSKRKAANRTPVRQSRRLYEKRRLLKARPRSLSFDGCSTSF